MFWNTLGVWCIGWIWGHRPFTWCSKNNVLRGFQRMQHNLKEGTLNHHSTFALLLICNSGKFVYHLLMRFSSDFLTITFYSKCDMKHFENVLSLLTRIWLCNVEYPFLITWVTCPILSHRFTPLGVGSVICGKIISIADIAVALQQLSLFILCTVGGFLIYQLIISQLIYFFILKRNPYEFYYQFTPAIVTAFATASK